jgi:hypothetical protein
MRQSAVLFVILLAILWQSVAMARRLNGERAG